MEEQYYIHTEGEQAGALGAASTPSGRNPATRLSLHKNLVTNFSHIQSMSILVSFQSS